MTLSRNSVFYRLRHLGKPLFPISASPTFTSRCVRRETIANKFGGTGQGLIQKPLDVYVRAHGYTHFLCPQLDTNPHVPQVPGAHGLIFRCGAEDGIVGNEKQRQARGELPHKVIVGLAPGQWLYTGDYLLEEGEKLSTEEWGRLPQKVIISKERFVLLK